MRIAVIGGREKSDEPLLRMAARYGAEIEFHPGDLHGGTADLKAAVARSTFVVIVTEINSHGAVIAAKRAARHFQTPTLVMRKLSIARLRGLLDALAKHQGAPGMPLAAAAHRPEVDPGGCARLAHSQRSPRCSAA